MERLHREQPRAERLLLRGLCFALVDEADSVLIDEARTPLILSGPGGSPEQRKTYKRAIRLAKALEEGRDFELQRRNGKVELSECGRQRLEELAAPLPADGIMGGAPTSAIVGGAIDHTAHHRGALTVYARLLGRVAAMPYA